MTLSDDCPVAIQYHELPPLHLGKPAGGLIVCSPSTSGLAISTTPNALLKQNQFRGCGRAQLGTNFRNQCYPLDIRREMPFLCQVGLWSFRPRARTFLLEM